jgi:hypothetical protein
MQVTPSAESSQATVSQGTECARTFHNQGGLRNDTQSDSLATVQTGRQDVHGRSSGTDAGRIESNNPGSTQRAEAAISEPESTGSERGLLGEGHGQHPIVAEALRLGWPHHRAVALEHLADKYHCEITPLFAGFWRNPTVTGWDTDKQGVRTPRIREAAIWTVLSDEQVPNIRASSEWATSFAAERGWSTERGLVWT